MRRLKLFFCVLCFISFLPMKAQLISVKSNIAADCLGFPNLSSELVLSPHITFEGEVMSGTGLWKKNISGGAIIPAVKYWLGGRAMTGLNVGVALMASAYKCDWKETKYNGDAIGAGLIVGYCFPLSSRLNLEFSAGYGGSWYKENQTNQGITELVRDFRPFVMKTGISLAYIIK